MGAAQVLSHLQAAGFRLHADRDKLTVAPASLLSDGDRDIIKAHRSGLLALLTATPAGPNRAEVPWLQVDCRPYRLTRAEGATAHADAWDEAAIARFQARAGLIRRHGFDEQDADDLAERLHLRDVHADYRHLCLECRHYRRGRCGNRRAAGLMTVEVARDVTTMFQHCPGFEGEQP